MGYVTFVPRFELNDAHHLKTVLSKVIQIAKPNNLVKICFRFNSTKIWTIPNDEYGASHDTMDILFVQQPVSLIENPITCAQENILHPPSISRSTHISTFLQRC